MLAYLKESAAPGASTLPSLTRQSSTAMRLNISGLTRVAELNSLQLRWILAMGTCEFVFAISTENSGIPLGRVPAGPCATEISFFREHLTILFVADPFTALTYYNYRLESKFKVGNASKVL